MNPPLQQTPLGKALDYDGTQHQTIDTGKKS